MDDCGHARITDFGLATVTKDAGSEQSTSEDQTHTTRWTAPEILTEQGKRSKEADVFSFAMVMIQVGHGSSAACRALAYHRFVSIQAFTGMVPFHGKPPAAATFDIMRGARPPRPTHPNVTEGLWKLMQRCWDHNPYSRPKVSEVLQVLLTPLVSHSF